MNYRPPTVQPLGVEIGYTPHSYPENRVSRNIIPFDFTRSPQGRVVKCVILITAHSMGYSNDRLLKEMPPQQELFDLVIKRVPWLPVAYFLGTGSEITPNIVWKRLYQMFYNNSLPKGKRRVMTAEHPYHAGCREPMVRTWNNCHRAIESRVARELEITEDEAAKEFSE